MNKLKVSQFLNSLGYDIEVRSRLRKSGYWVHYVMRIGDKKYTTSNQTEATRELEHILASITQEAPNGKEEDK